MTGGGQLKLVAEGLSVAMLRALISAGGGRVEARWFLKKVDVGMGAIFSCYMEVTLYVSDRLR